MTPETTVFMVAAERALANANRILAINIADQAARLAYYAQFHAAQALIFERTAKNAKTHKGVDSQFHRLAKLEPILNGLAGQLSGAYRFKEAADYDADAAASITEVDARDAIATAERFVAVIARVLAV
jgi:uncharacterized protein (UPF0332 family)